MHSFFAILGLFSALGCVVFAFFNISVPGASETSYISAAFGIATFVCFYVTNHLEASDGKKQRRK